MDKSLNTTLQAIFDNWELDSGDPDDIMDALNEAYQTGARDGGMDSEVFEEALEFFSKFK